MQTKLTNFHKTLLSKHKQDELISINLADLEYLKSQNLTLEDFLNYLVETKKVLLHGSVYKIDGNCLISNRKKIYATNNPKIAIMRSIYSNEMINLSYPYMLKPNQDFTLEVHTQKDGKHTKVDTGYIYVIQNTENFINEPINSWQYVNYTEKIPFTMVIQTHHTDFKNTVKFFDDFEFEPTI